MWKLTMAQDLSIDGRMPAFVIATAATVGAFYAPSGWVKGALAGLAMTAGAAALIACGASMDARQDDAQPHWRTLKTYRVEAD